jgi:hypothetical protein
MLLFLLSLLILDFFDTLICSFSLFKLLLLLFAAFSVLVRDFDCSFIFNSLFLEFIMKKLIMKKLIHTEKEYREK